MRHYLTFAETEALLRKAVELPGRGVRVIGAATGIKPNTLYKWRSGAAHLSPRKADALLLYFMETEPERLELAQAIMDIQ